MNSNVKKKFLPLFVPVFFIGAIVFALFTVSCQSGIPKTKQFIIWTDRKEFVSYAEMFNSISEKEKAVIVYKNSLSNALPPANDEEKPDIIVGSWLNNSRTRKNFRSLDGLLSVDSVNTDTFYSPLLEFGKLNGVQYLLPVSFNIPLFIFSSRNEKLIENSYTLESDKIKEISASYNEKNKNGFYTNMGFAPSWNIDFVYTILKMNNIDFREKGGEIIWNNDALLETVEYFKNWTLETNTSTSLEMDFDFKYLYTPEYKQVDSGRCLFAYTNSESIFGIPYEQLGDIDFRWLSYNGKIPVRDNIVTLGIYKYAKNADAAKKFIIWFFEEESQKKMLERNAKMNLASSTFGLAGGFSSLKAINEQTFLLYYRNLLGNLPPEDYLVPPPVFPARWESIKERVVFPYLTEATNTDETGEIRTMQSRLDSWSKQFD